MPFTPLPIPSKKSEHEECGIDLNPNYDVFFFESAFLRTTGIILVLCVDGASI